VTLNVVKNATCTFCGCVCDDIELHADGERIVKAKNACSLGDAWFKHHTAEHAYPISKRCKTRIGFESLDCLPGSL